MSAASTTSSSSSSSCSPSCERTFSCPRCAGHQRFTSFLELQDHLVNTHTYQTLLDLSKVRARSSASGALLPLPGPTVPQKQSCPLRPPLPLACLDLASSSASTHLLGEMFGPGAASLGPPWARSTALALRSATGSLPGPIMVELEGQLGLSRGLGLELSSSRVDCFGVRPGLEERLGLGFDRQVARTLAEVEERVKGRVRLLKAELQEREAELEQERRDGERLRKENEEVEENAAFLSRQVSIAMKMMEGIKRELKGKEKQLAERQQEMRVMECFLRETAEKESEAKAKLQIFIETILERADFAERQLLQLSSLRCTHTMTGYTHTPSHTPVPCPAGHSLDGSADDIPGTRSPVTMVTQRSYSVSGSSRLGEQFYNHQYNYGDQGCRMRTLSLGSGGFWSHRSGGEGRFGGCSWGQNCQRYHSTEEEEEEEELTWRSTELERHTPQTAFSSSRSTPSRCHGTRDLGAEILRLRAGLFCVFPYLDVPSLLRVAEVCSDWRFVARHPAVWTHLLLENAQVSAQFLVTLSQWCTQTHSLVLTNLTPRCRRPDESREDYQLHTRGCLEEGLEAVLRSAGGSLLHLSVSRCPNILTDRTLWLASCYSKSLHTLIYRSHADPLGHEVLWALGAGCRNISNLQVAPLHPCQQFHRLGNRCLQTIGRCWPHLRSLSVGGAGVGTQGLTAVVSSCVDLQELELEHITSIDLKVATELCNNGLNKLQALILTHTPVTEEAILYFQSKCVHLRSIVVEVSVMDYFEEETLETHTLFRERLGALQALTRCPGLCDVLQVKEDVC